jgi:hypothetical protein
MRQAERGWSHLPPDQHWAVTEPPGTEIKADPSRLAIFKDYVRNVATWLQAPTSRHIPKDRYDQRVPAHH